MELPILAEEQEIVEAVLLNSVVVLSGETGSGKTTQVPQFLYEAGFGVPGSDNPGMIGITQPRRVAAVATASRVSYELGLPAPIVAHQVRYARTTSPQTRIKFMTDGVLLRELAGDLMLGKYSVVIVDEAHERGVNTDVLIGVLSRVVRLREKLWREGKEGIKPLRLIIMSATLRLTDFAQNPTLFPAPPPVISITARQHPVTIHFDRRTRGDYIRATETKVAKIHARLPPGGVLVFMTGQREIVELCKRLGRRFGKWKVEKEKERVEGMGAGEGVVESEEVELGDRRDDVQEGDDGGLEENADEEALDSDDEEEAENQELQIDTEQSDVPMHIVPLYSLLPGDQQMKVFEPPPDGARLVVIATNVAETSLTIPGIRYVVDAGRAKEMKSMGIDAVVNFPFPTPPDREALRKAEVVLTHLGALAGSDSSSGGLRRTGAAGTGNSIVVGGQITPLGKTMALFPVTPRFAKMLAIGRQQGCLAYVIAIAAVLSVGDPFLREEALEADEGEVEEEDLAPEYTEIQSEELRAKEVRKARRRDFFRAVQAMEEIHKLRQQITHIVVSTFPETGKELDAMMKPPSEKQTKLLQQIITSGFIDQIAVRKDYIEKQTGVKRTSARGVAYQAIGVKDDVFIHPSSVLFNGPPPDFVAFQEVVRTSRAWLKVVTRVNPSWLPALGPSLSTYSKPLKVAAVAKTGKVVVVPRFGPYDWELPMTMIDK
ncbi:putative ATP-dependent RNA helicase DHR1 [Ceratobasidium sp. 370]|nr:putative ATP-dependent RNA helicase DHR1 [Ceratobasidium sp. 370]